MKSIKNKIGVGMAINMIIIATLGILILLVAIFLIRRTTTLVNDQIPKLLEIPAAMWKPTLDNPFMLYPYKIDVKQGKSQIITLQVFNYADKDVMCNLVFNPVVNTGTDAVKFVYATTNRAIPVNMVGEWKIRVEALRTAIPDVYMYTLNINCTQFSNQQDIFITVK